MPRMLALASLLAIAGLAYLSAAAADAPADGTKLYETSCAKCHGADGHGDTTMGKAMKAKSLVDPKWAAADSADALVSAFRANPKHKSVASKVSDDDLRAIAVHVRELAGGSTAPK
ncbi:MAG: c-type cytochrome [Myxococcales bacterium]|nr:MAG: c-type cytochrome [Myxococcales bacterium]